MTGTRRRTVCLAAVGTLAAAGCVDRRFVVESNAPAAQVFFDGNPIGLAPADGKREYAGYYTIQVMAAGYETVTERVKFAPRWYDYPPLDLFAEVLWPFRIEDVRRVRIDLPAAQPVNQAALTANADALRAKGLGMRESVVPDTPKGRPTAGGVPTPPPPAPDAQRPFQGNIFPAPLTGGVSGGDPGVVPTGPGVAPGR